MNDSIVTSNEKLIYKIISKYQGYFELDDLYQEAAKGIIKAYKKYDSKYNVKFTTFAYPYILGEVIKYINDFRSIKVSKSNKMLYSKILKSYEILSQKLMKVPTTYELSIFLEIDEKIINEVLSANAYVDSLDKIIMEDGKELELYDLIGYNDQSIENYQLMSEIDKLSVQDREIIKDRYYFDMSQKEVGEKLGMYQVEVSRKETKILKKLYDNIA